MKNTLTVKKGVITVAGLGTRFLPATKAMPKEMLPVLDKPVVQYIVEEMANSGITEIIFVTSSQKRAIEDHFDRDYELEDKLAKNDKLHHIQELINLSKKVKFFYTRQSEPLGNGHALLCAKEFLGDEPFAFSDGDSIIDAKVPVVKQLVQVFNKVKSSVIGVQRIEDKQAMTKYGNVYGKNLKIQKFKDSKISERIYKVEKFVEKPSLKNVSPEGLIIGGMRYIFTKDIWACLEKQKMGRGGEIWVADAANALAKAKPFYAFEYEGQYFDTGNKVSLLKTAIHFAEKEGLL
ncbi:MAG: sugar phosphate nucleotidyltransferase [Candidatus Magasanikiibacteriota bacterium]